MSEGIAVLRQIEDIVVEGEPLTGAQCAAKTVLLGGMALRSRAALLVSDYEAPDGATASVALPKGYGGTVAELTPGGPKPVRAVDRTIHVTFGPARAHVYLLGE